MRFLRRDNPETRDVFMLLANWNLVKTDLLPIIRTYHDDSELVIAASKSFSRFRLHSLLLSYNIGITPVIDLIVKKSIANTSAPLWCVRRTQPSWWCSSRYL